MTTPPPAVGPDVIDRVRKFHTKPKGTEAAWARHDAFCDAVLPALLDVLELCGCWCNGGPPEERPCQRCIALAALARELPK